MTRLVSESADPAARFRELEGGIRRGGLRRHPAVAAMVALALVAAVAVPATIALTRGTGAATVAGDAIAAIDAGTGKLEGSVALGSRPGDVAVGDDSVWVTLPDRGTVERIDPATMTVRDTIPVGADPEGIAIVGDSVWVTNVGSGNVWRIRPDRGTTQQKVELPGGPAGIAADREGIWVADSYDASVARIDAGTGQVDATVPVGDRPLAVAAGDEGIWVANEVSGTVSRVDSRGATQVLATRVGNGPAAIAVGADGVWVANALDGTVSRLDPGTGTVQQTVRVGGTPSGIAIDGGTTWVSGGTDGSVARIDSRSGTVERIPLGAETGHLTVADGTVWVSVRGSTSSHRGGTLTVWGSKDLFDTVDPALAYYPQSWAMLALTNDGLVGFRRTGGLNGATLVPDLSRSLPQPTSGGRVYTFELRPNIRYSTGRQVRPEDFRRAIERVLAARDATGAPSGGAAYYSRIVGAEACTPGRACDLSNGIVADDGSRTVTFRLTTADPEFPYELALPFADPVPEDLGGVPEGSVPATGPYLVTRIVPGDRVEFGRNPRFRSWSPAARPDGFADRIVWRLGSDPDRMADEVTHGRADLLFTLPSSDRIAELARDDARRLYLTPSAATFFLSFDTRSPPFDDVRVRRALNFAIDRNQVQRLVGPQTRVSCQILPPNFPGYLPFCPFSEGPGDRWTAPDMATARSLVAESGTAGTKVTVWAAPDYFPQVAGYVRDVLERLRYRASVHSVDDAAYGRALFGHPRKAQVAFTGWTTDFPSEEGFIGAIARCDAPSNESGFCDRALDLRMDRASRLQVSDPAAARRQWSSIEHDIVVRAPWVPLVDRNWANLVSGRLGNFLVSPQWGPLVDQMWVR
ncbi:MAG TPA: ABC transporter substrate-binding protein [Actinomycetota bacterium]